jgi:hypothetical protein
VKRPLHVLDHLLAEGFSLREGGRVRSASEERGRALVLLLLMSRRLSRRGRRWVSHSCASCISRLALLAQMACSLAVGVREERGKRGEGGTDVVASRREHLEGLALEDNLPLELLPQLLQSRQLVLELAGLGGGVVLVALQLLH